MTRRKRRPGHWMGTVLPFELFGTCRSGVPITFVGLGRMDLTGIQREIGPIASSKKW